MVDTEGEDQGLVVWEIPEPRLGMPVTDVERKDTGHVTARIPVRDYKKEIIDPRHMDLPEAEVSTQEDTKLQTQTQRRWPSTLWPSTLWPPGAGARNSTDGTHRDRTALEWQIPCCQ